MQKRLRVAHARIKIKISKIDMALKIVLRRNTRKNNVNYQ